MGCCRCTNKWGGWSPKSDLVSARLSICGKCQHATQAKVRGQRSQTKCEKCNCLVEERAKTGNCPIGKW